MAPLTSSARDWIGARMASRSARNVAWNAAGGLWVGALTTLATPWYVFRLGMDGYGILGLWLVMQVMVGLLDLGLGATVVKEFARTDGGPGCAARKADLLRTLEVLFWAIAATVLIALVAASEWLAGQWLQTPSHQVAELSAALRGMGAALSLQFPGALYSNGLAGLQDQGRMNRLQILGSTLRFGGGAAVLLWRPDLTGFFVVQAGAAATQTLLTRHAVWSKIGRSPRPPGARIEILRRVWRFSAGMAATAASGLLLANVDRLFLSRMVPASELGKYSLAFTAAGLLQMGIQPFYRAYFPRFAELVAARDLVRLRDEYLDGCRVMAAVMIPLAVAGGVFAPQLFRAWIGESDPTIVLTFRWLLVGVGASGLMWLPAAFQQAHGWTRLHASMILGALIAGSAAMAWSIRAFGPSGATVAWVIHGLSDITVGLWLMHRRLLTGTLLVWYRSVLLPPLVSSASVAALCWLLAPTDLGRWGGLLWMAGSGALLMAASLVAVLRARHPPRSHSTPSQE